MIDEKLPELINDVKQLYLRIRHYQESQPNPGETEMKGPK